MEINTQDKFKHKESGRIFTVVGITSCYYQGTLLEETQNFELKYQGKKRYACITVNYNSLLEYFEPVKK